MRNAPLIALVSLSAANFAHGATIAVVSPDDGQPASVLIDGNLETGDGDQFRSKTSFLSKAVVSFRSDGGSVVAGLQIGESIRLKGFTTFVAAGTRCASACALAWLGGTRRIMSAESRIGFHAAYTRDGQETGVGNAIIGAYLNKIGLPYSAVIYITKAAPDSMTWLSVAEAEKLGIDVELFDSRRVVVAPMPLNPSAPTPPRSKANEERKKVSVVAPPPTPATRAPGMRAEDIIGRWGLALYHKDQDRVRAEIAARGQCFQPYVIDRSPVGDVRMLGHDNPQIQDMKIKASIGGKTYIGPGPIPGGADDREVVAFDGRVLVLKWINPDIVSRYGIMVLVRCAS
jgi:hypothetical protein